MLVWNSDGYGILMPGDALDSDEFDDADWVFVGGKWYKIANSMHGAIAIVDDEHEGPYYPGRSASDIKPLPPVPVDDPMDPVSKDPDRPWGPEKGSVTNPKTGVPELPPDLR